MTTGKVKVAIARDEAFQFYYRDVLEDFEEAGVEWISFRLCASLYRKVFQDFT